MAVAAESCRNRKGGPPNRAIHACAKGKGVFVCMDCMDFPCEKWNAISRIHPLLEKDTERYREVGKEKWLDEQRAKAKKGFYNGMVKQSSTLGQDGKKDERLLS